MKIYYYYLMTSDKLDNLISSISTSKSIHHFHNFDRIDNLIYLENKIIKENYSFKPRTSGTFNLSKEF
ncbi:hypothetical protein BpHYR1_024626 [Brachionus plicatilis]|uniref:Uncharacterized protein n=1 Tax=Brachionus plicatilis TaxID=10195 RepID=A0A3M7SQT0_BRAPC|nr:hypothetical protein BpHYR1_024626 [Brachionus plicatilis]